MIKRFPRKMIRSRWLGMALIGAILMLWILPHPALAGGTEPTETITPTVTPTVTTGSAPGGAVQVELTPPAENKENAQSDQTTNLLPPTQAPAGSTAGGLPLGPLALLLLAVVAFGAIAFLLMRRR